jgi:sugar porter (SP) family MFS transporter
VDQEEMSLKSLRGTKLNLAIAFAGALAWLLQGYDQAVMNGLLTLDTFDSQFPTLDTNRPGINEIHASLIQGTAVAIYEVGCAFGSVSCYFLGDLLGRRRMIILCGCIVTIGVILQTTSFQLVQLIIGRVVTGLGVGGYTATIPMWISECSSAQLRGRLVLLSGALAISGVATASWIEFGFYFLQDNSVNWRFPVALQALFAMTSTLMVKFLPESPRWLVKKRRVEEAAEIFARLEDTTTDSDHVQNEIAIIEQSLEEDVEATTSSPFAITKNKHLRRTLMAIWLNIGAQMTGVNVVTFYSTSIFQEQLGYNGVQARIFSASLQIWQVLAAFFSILVIERFGRRNIMMHAAALMAIAQFCLGGLSSNLKNPACGKAIIAFYFLALYAFPVGLLQIPFMYSAEIAPLEVRSQITAVSSASNWIFNFVVAEASPTAFRTIGYKYYFVYGSISTALLISLYLVFPETKGRTLEEIDDIFVQSETLFDTPGIAKSLPFSGDATNAFEQKHQAQHIEEVA